MRRSINHPDHTLLDDKPVNKQRLSFQGGQKVSKAHGFVETGLTDHPIHKRNPLKSICCHLKWGKRCISKYSKNRERVLRLGVLVTIPIIVLNEHVIICAMLCATYACIVSEMSA